MRRYLSSASPFGAGLHGSDDLPPDVRVHVLGPSRDLTQLRRLNPPVDQAYRVRPVIETSSVDPEPEPAQLDELDDMVEEETFDEGPDVIAKPPDVSRFASNTSLVLLIEVGGQKLLFPGDAHWGSWEQLLEDPATRSLLSGTTFYKVSHHGSANGTPREFVEGGLLARGAVSMVPVAPTQYGGGWKDIPYPALLDALGSVGRVIRSDETPSDAMYVEVSFPVGTYPASQS